MNQGKLTPEQISDYHRDGYVIVRGLFDTEEIDLLRRASKDDKAESESRRRARASLARTTALV